MDVNTDGSLSGFQTWEFYTRGWKRSQSADEHICSRVQALDGVVVADLVGCEACVAAYSIALTEVDTDCDTSLAGQASYAAVTHYAVGEVPDEIAEDDPYPGRSLGWYQSFDGDTVEAMGFAWNDQLGSGSDGGVAPGWSTDAGYVLWPAWAWEL